MGLIYGNIQILILANKVHISTVKKYDEITKLFFTLLLSNAKQNLEIWSKLSGFLRIYKLFYKYYYLDLRYKTTLPSNGIWGMKPIRTPKITLKLLSKYFHQFLK